MLYLLAPADEFSVVHHPLQPAVQHLHILTAPLLVFATALLWRRHAWERIQTGFPHRRRTGLILFLDFVPMVASGYLLQVSVEESWRTAWLALHLASSGIWILATLVHQVLPRSSAAELARAGAVRGRRLRSGS